jgi:hypothetical protein
MEPRFRHCEEQSDAAIQPSSNEPKNLTRRANHRHIFIIARIAEPGAGKPAAGFFNGAAVSSLRRAKRRGNPAVVQRTEEFDTSGKSPAYLHHRKNFRARAGKPAAGFFNRTAAAFATHYLLSVARRVCKRAAVRASTARYHPLANASRLPWGKPLRTFPDRALLAGARERAGRGVDLVHSHAVSPDDPPCGLRRT